MYQYLIGFIICILLCFLFYYFQYYRISDMVSIGIPCIPKHISHLDELIQNINKQKLLPTEVIISLSECSQQEGMKLEYILKKKCYVNVKVITDVRKKYAGANRNTCAEYCTTPYISFIDADDLMSPTRILIIDKLAKKYDFDVLFHNYTMDNHYSSEFSKINDVNYNYQTYLSYNTTDKSKSVMLENTHHGHLTIKTKQLLRYPIDVGGYGEDTRYLHTLFNNKLNVISLPDYKGTYYRIKNSSWNYE